MSIRKASPTFAPGTPRVDFSLNVFDKLIDDKGYEIIKYDAISCPCKLEGSESLVNCENCLGLGWVFINPIEIKAILTSINRDTKYKYWSPEFLGTVSVTVKDLDSQRLSHMDKIVMKNETSILSEVRPVKTTGTQKFIFTSYPIKEVNSVFLFNGSTNPLIRLTEDQYSISEDNPYVLKLDSGITFPTDFNNSISIDYKHRVEYLIQDIPHNIRVSTYLDSKGKSDHQSLPVQAIARLAHYVNGNPINYDGSGLQDNSYL